MVPNKLYLVPRTSVAWDSMWDGSFKIGDRLTPLSPAVNRGKKVNPACPPEGEYRGRFISSGESVTVRGWGVGGGQDNLRLDGAVHYELRLATM